MAAKSFDEKVWNLTAKIPKGKVTTYRLIARKLGTTAYRAVGNALNRNPHAPRVPCHRVVKSNGEVGGFAQGTRQKIKMLRKEGIKIKNNKIEYFEKVLFSF
ncbi:MAG: MGMT family protein [Candidatus Woesearchaeota archaeon]|nr:MGMT family protein [Candidatus Woesearchaeota archaeon]